MAKVHKLWVSRIENIWLRRVAIVASFPFAMLVIVPFAIQALFGAWGELFQTARAVWSMKQDNPD